MPFGFVNGTDHDAGGKVRLPLLPGVTGSAGYVTGMPEHRLWLARDWGDIEGAFLLSIGMNPSTAEADVDDLTLRKDQGFTQRFGYARLVKCNIGSYRATDPAALAEIAEPCHPENIRTILKYSSMQGALILLCCGDLPPALQAAGKHVFALLRQLDKPLWHLGLTKAGYPKHTSRLGYREQLQELSQWPV